MSKTLNILGCGKVGKTLGRLLVSHEVFAVQDVLNRTLASATEAVAFLGAGRPITDYRDLRVADVYMIAVPDDRIVDCCEALALHGHMGIGALAFQCSGARPSSEMLTAFRSGALVASVHPIRSFADPAHAVKNFAETYCGVEGDEGALEVLQPAFTDVGARVIRIDSQAKALYHAATVFACNYAVTLLETARQALKAAGITEHLAPNLLESLVKENVAAVLNLYPRGL